MNYDKLSSENISLPIKRPHYSKLIQNRFIFFSIVISILTVICIIVFCLLIYYYKSNKTQSITIYLLSKEVNDLKMAIQNYEYQNEQMKNELIELKPKNLMPLKEIQSLIKNGEMAFIESLFQGKGIRLISLYQARIDGDSKEEFEKNLKGVPLLLVVVETKNGLKIGGYINTICDNYSSGGIISEEDPNAFLFSITNKKAYHVLSWSHAKHCRSDHLISFNADLLIHERCLSSMSSSFFPTNYNTPYKDAAKYELLNGDSEFAIKDVEVFKVIFKKDISS